MSRQVPLDRALSDEDRRYLRYLGSYGADMEQRIDAQFPPDPDALRAFELKYQSDLRRINGIGLNDNDQSAVYAENQALKAELEALKSQLAASESSGDDEVPNYNDKRWTKSALEAEIDRVNSEDPDAKLSKGSKEEMAAALTAYFSE